MFNVRIRETPTSEAEKQIVEKQIKDGRSKVVLLL